MSFELPGSLENVLDVAPESEAFRAFGGRQLVDRSPFANPNQVRFFPKLSQPAPGEIKRNIPTMVAIKADLWPG
jgi:hypothetical protein